jgi:hypothetical protein
MPLNHFKVLTSQAPLLVVVRTDALKEPFYIRMKMMIFFSDGRLAQLWSQNCRVNLNIRVVMKLEFTARAHYRRAVYIYGRI